MNEGKQKLFVEARGIAVASLRQCYSDGKIKASLKNFSDYWARDTFWAIFGVLEIEDFEIARQCLEYFLSYQRSDGKIPRKIALDYNSLKYLTGKSIARKKPCPIWTANLPPFSCMDANSLFIIAFSNYVEKTQDVQFGKKYYSQVKKAALWYEKHLKDGFLLEYGLSNWMDTIFKNGHVLYSNVLYAHCLKTLSVLATDIGANQDVEFFEKKYEETKNKINRRFWNGKWFDDQLGSSKNFDLAGNVLACYYEIADNNKRKIILKKILSLREKKILLPSVDPKYPWWKVNLATYPFGMQDYQNGASWLWIDLFAMGALYKNGFAQEAQEYFCDVCKIIVKNGAVHETYFERGAPYKARHWESAVPFAWNSGVFLHILQELGI